MEYTVISPLKVPTTKKKYFILNLNNYRNTHFQVLNKAKVVYKNEISNQINKLPNFTKVYLECVVYPATKRLSDIDNVGSIHLKFFQDALVEAGKIPDDNYLYIPIVLTKIGKIDKHNPRVEIIIHDKS